MDSTRLFSFRTFALQLTISLALLVVLAACGGSDGSAGASATSELNATSNGATAEVAFESDSPIDNMIGVPIMDEAAMNDYVLDVLTEGEFKTAECMVGEGFEYTPIVPTSSIPSVDDVGSDSGREYAKTRGFGIVAQFNESQFDPADPPVNANHTYRASLSAAELDAYEMALWGDVSGEQSDFDGQSDDDENFDDGQGSDNGFGGPAVGGCKALASEELFKLFNTLDEFTPDAEQIFDAWLSDPRVIESNKTWATCMTEQGFSVDDDPDEVREQVIIRLDEVLQSVDFGQLIEGNEPPVGYDERDNAGEFLSGDYFGEVPKLDPVSQAKIDELGQFEIELATAHHDCLEPLLESNMAVQREYEQQLVDSIGPALTERLGNS